MKLWDWDILINEYLREVVSNMHRCQHCVFNHDGVCYFAFDCIKKDFYFYCEED